MKYLIHICLLCTNLLSFAGVVQPPPTRTIEDVPDGIVVTYYFDNPEIVESEYYENTKYIRYDGFGLNDNDGEPCIPFRNDTYLVPNNCAVTLSMLDSVYNDTTFVLSPSMPIMPDNGSRVMKHTITPYFGFFPTNIIHSSGVYLHREDALISVSISPVKYNYQTNTVRRYSLIKYKLTYSGTNYKYNGKSTSLARKICQNTSHSRSSADSTIRDDRHYLIITTTEYKDCLEDFVRWKRLKGYNVHIASRPKGSWTTDSVLNVVNGFFTGDSIKYLLIVGDVDDVPGVPFSYIYWDGNSYVTANAVTDFEYGLPSGTVNIPQIFRGRIPADNAQQVTTVLNKIIQYEKMPIIDDDFYHRGLNCAEFQDSNNDGREDRCFLMTSENIRNHVLIQGFQAFQQYVRTSSADTLRWNSSYSNGTLLPDSLQPNIFSWNGNSSMIASHINNGVFYVLHRDHGETNGWGHPPFKTNNINQLQNGNKLPIVFSLNCLTGKYDLLGDCFAEAFLKKSDGGCAGIYAATEVSFSGYNDAMALGMFDAIWPNLQPTHYFIYYPGYSSTPTPTYELGQILDQGFIRMGTTMGHKSYYSMVTKRLFHCFGDPSMQIYTEKPHFFAEPLIYSRGDSIFVFSEDGDCKITFYDKVTEDVKSYKGNYAAYANPSDNLVICLDRHNYVPYIWDYSKDLYIQNEDIQNETRVYRGNTIYMGNNVTSTKPAGDVNIQNSYITIQGNKLEIRQGTRIDKNFKFQNR